MLVFLTGYMYSGKTTVARQLSERLAENHGFDTRWTDTDQEVENRYHVTVSDCFRRYGEAMFRKLETDVLRSISAQQGRSVTIVATGGGTPCHDRNMQWMRDHGLTVYLKLPVGETLARMAVSRKPRPTIIALKPAEREAFVRGQVAVREPVYEQAHLTIDASNPDIDALADAVVAHYNALHSDCL